MIAGRPPGRALSTNDALDLVAETPLTGDEAAYVAAARAANTLRGYRSHWAEFTGWCARRRDEPLPAAPATVTGSTCPSWPGTVRRSAR